MYVDVHAHLTDKRFESDLDNVISECEKHGLSSIIVNGIDPETNRAALEMADKYTIIKAALGIYPVNAAGRMAKGLPFPVPDFDIDREIEFIADSAKNNKISAIGECGLDGYWIKEETYECQEKVFRQLIEIALSNDLPIIVHTRKLESRSIEILASYKAPKVIFHCFGGKTDIAVKTAEKEGWSFSIPANATKNEAFKKMLLLLPKEAILTETDSPYLSPEKGERNTPLNVIKTVEFMARLRNLETAEAKEIIWNNYKRLFTSRS
ncbi:MAG: TatD family hydrolase [Oligoflexales bacterium]|nr:TatD family hydrolase [Oligoflexales bacterium]